MSDEVTPVETPSLETPPPSGAPVVGRRLDLIGGVKVRVEARIGEAEISVKELFELGANSVVALDCPVTQPIDLVLDDRVVARGTLVAVGDQLGLRVTEVATQS